MSARDEPSGTRGHSRADYWKFLRRSTSAISTPSRVDAALIGATILISAISLWLRTQIPLSTVTPRAGRYDDSLMIRGASHLEHGQWLGPFDSLTLAKGASYPMFVALTHNLGISLKIGEQLTYLLAALCLAAAIWVITRRRWLSFAAYAVLAFDPAKFAAIDGRVLRDGWSSSLALLFIASLFVAVYGALSRIRLVWIVSFALLSGLSGAAFLLCREEGAWIDPSLAIVALGLPLAAFVKWRFRTPRHTAPRGTKVLYRRAVRLAVTFLVIGVGLYAPITAVKIKNEHVYGSALTNDMSQGWIFRAYADWSRVRAGPQRRYVPISHAQREAVYQISPAALQLAPFLENPHQRAITAGGCLSAVRICDDLAGGWMLWTLRGAAEDAGHFTSESAAQSFFHQISEDINRACDRGSLHCATRLPAALQPLQLVAAGPWFHSFGRLVQRVVWSKNMTVVRTSPLGITPAERAVIMQSVAGVPPSQAAEDRALARVRSRSWLYGGLAEIYHVLFPVLLALALVGAAAALRRPRWPGAALSVLFAALSVGVLTNLALLAVIDSSEFRTADRYSLSARTFLLALGVVGSAQLVEKVRAIRQSTSRPVQDGGASDPPREVDDPDSSRRRSDVALTTSDGW
jgi:hypothetical protein